MFLLEDEYWFVVRLLEFDVCCLLWEYLILKVGIVVLFEFCGC